MAQQQLCCRELREAQLSQRNRAMLHVIEYFSKSLKVTQGHSKLEGHSVERMYLRQRCFDGSLAQ